MESKTFDATKLTQAEAEALSEQIGSKIRQICDDSVAKANEILSLYGMSAKMQIVVGPLESKSEAHVLTQESQILDKKDQALQSS